MLKNPDGTRRALAGVAVMLALMVILATPAMAVTNGKLDGNNHPYVGLMVAKNSSGTPSGDAAARSCRRSSS